MPEHLQLEMLRYAMDRVANLIPVRDPYDPVDTPEYELWKVIIPVRPETYERLLTRIPLCPNKNTWTLDPVCHDDLDRTRGQLLEDLVERTDRHVQELIWLRREEAKPPLKLTPAKVAGRILKQSFRTRVAEKDVAEEAPAAAQRIYDELVDGSARRYLLLRRRLTMSRTINKRLAQAKLPEWAGPRLSHFYFLDGLLCGESGVYEATDEDNLILNLYDMGINTAGDDPYRLLVGIHVISLLRNEADWPEVRKQLIAIGYPPSELEQACWRLVQKGVMKLITRNEEGDDRYQVETAIVRAHWQLLQARAYTDNVAASLGMRLQLVEQDSELETDPLEYSDFARRVNLSCAFLLRVRKVQDELRNPDTARARHQRDNTAFREQLGNLSLPDVFAYAGHEYRKRVEGVIKGRLQDYLRRHSQLNRVSKRLEVLPDEYDESVNILRMATQPQ